MIKFVLTVTLSISICLAQNSVVVKKDERVPFDGVLSDSKQMQEYRKVAEEKDILISENLKLKDLALVQEQRAVLFKEEVKLVKEDLRSLEKRSFWANIGYFTLGVVITGFAAKVAIESTRK